MKIFWKLRLATDFDDLLPALTAAHFDEVVVGILSRAPRRRRIRGGRVDG